MGDPLSDARAGQLLAADLGEINALAAQFRRVGTQAQTAAAGLRGAQNDATWDSPAAQEFRTKLGKLPGDLDKVQQSYGDAATALDTYESNLGPIRTQFQSLATQLQSAQSSLSSAQGQLNTAQSGLTTATTAPHAKATSPAVASAHSAVQSATSAVGQMQGEVSGLQSRVYHLLDEFDGVRGHARSAVSSAAGLAPQDHSSWFGGMMHSIGSFMSGVGHVFVNMAKGVWHAAESLPSDAWKVITHPTNLHDWAKLGEDAGTVAGAVALVAAVVLCPADALGLEGVVEVAEAADAAAGTVGTYAAGGKLVADTGLAAEGKQSWGEVGFDVVGEVTSKADLPAASRAETRAELLGGKSEALGHYAEARSLGLSHSASLRVLTDDERSLITHSASRLANPARLSYMRSTTAAELKAANTLKYRTGLVNEGFHSVLDEGTSAIKDKVLPDGSSGGNG